MLQVSSDSAQHRGGLARNADGVAAELDRVVRRVRPRFVLIAGEERARHLLQERMSPAVADLVVTTDVGGRAAGADRGRSSTR